MARCEFIENYHTMHVAPQAIIADCADLYDGSPATDVISLGGAEGAVFMIITNDVTAATATITVQACNNVTPSRTYNVPFYYRVIQDPDTLGTTTLATSAGFTTNDGSDRVYLIEVDACDLTSGSYEFCRMKMAEQSADCYAHGAVVAFLRGTRHKEDSLVSQAA